MMNEQQQQYTMVNMPVMMPLPQKPTDPPKPENTGVAGGIFWAAVGLLLALWYFAGGWQMLM
jgi:hypothetical protein